MSDIVIKAENLGKKYTIGHQAERGNYTALRDVLMQNARTLWNKTKDLASGKPIIQGDTLEEIWALKDVNFAIRRGEAVGIIGGNGAGKSTLLKILSRITEPSAGRVTIKGRVASLLEVGTGFHPELSGRENIYLNGTILGMTRAEIKQKFDAIVAFAEVEKYLDTPVKRYSSGMYVRLAFAVAAHLEPEILVVDEVLAVGDAQFQKKCLGKMEDVGKEGRTVLFVSHNMSAIKYLCKQAILLSEGQIIAAGGVETTIPFYLNTADKATKSMCILPDNPKKSTQISSVSIHFMNGDEIHRPMMIDESFIVRLSFKLEKPLPGAFATFEIKNHNGDYVLFSDSRDNPASASFEESGFISASIRIPAPLFVPGKYYATASIARPPMGTIDDCIDAVVFEIENIQGVRTNRPGYIYLPLEWQLNSKS